MRQARPAPIVKSLARSSNRAQHIVLCRFGYLGNAFSSRRVDIINDLARTTRDQFTIDEHVVFSHVSRLFHVSEKTEITNNLRSGKRASFTLQMHIVARQFAEERVWWHAHLRAERTAPGDLAFRQHIASDSERRSSIERACADAPAAIGVHNHLVRNL